jgi:hypothetical protein
MAELSIGMTSGLGDGVAGGYVSGRMTQMELKTLSNGQLIYTNNGSDQPFALSGTSTSTLNIGDGNALVSGFFYENTSAVTISVSGLTAATYFIVVAVNNSGGTQAVTRAVGGAATIPAYTVRLALVASVPSPSIQIGTVTTNGTTITAIAYTYSSYNIANSLSRQVYAQMSAGAATLTTALTNYDVTAYNSGSVINSTMDKVFTVNSTTGVITVNKSDLYLVTFTGNFSSGTTGWRRVMVSVAGTNTTLSRQTSSGFTSHEFNVSTMIYLNAGNDVKFVVSSSLATQSLSDGLFTIARV